MPKPNSIPLAAPLSKRASGDIIHRGANSQDYAAFAIAKPLQMREKDSMQSTKHKQRVKSTQTALPLLVAPVSFVCM